MVKAIDELSDITAESGIIATLIYHPEFILHSEHLSSRYFTDNVNRVLYWSISTLYKKGITNIDEYNIINQINSIPEAKEILDKFNINTVADIIKYANCTARNTLEEYLQLVNRVLTLSFKRDLYYKTDQWNKKCLDDNCQLGELYKYINNDISNLSEKYLINAEEVKIYGEIIDKIWQNICTKRKDGKYYGFPWKFPLLNDYCQIEKGELVVVAGQRKVGKSMLLMNQCAYALKNNIPCLYIDTELTTERFTERLLAHLTGISVKNIKTGNYTVSEEEMIKDVIEYLKTKSFVHKYMPVVSNDEVYALCKMLQYKMNLQILFYDYLKGSSISASEQYNELGNKTNFLKNDIAGGLNLAVVAGAQLNRQNEISDSFKIEMYTSTILNIRQKTIEEIQEDGRECGNYILWVKLNRNGDQHNVEADEYIDMEFNGRTSTIEQAGKQHEIINPFSNVQGDK